MQSFHWINLIEKYKVGMLDIKNKQLKYEKALEYEIFVKGEYSFAKEKIQTAECVFDIWWHVWLFSRRCRMLNQNAKIHYFEPIKELYDRAKNNLWNDKNVVLNDCWISSKSGSWTVLLNREKTMQSSKYTSFLNKNGTKLNVNFITLRDYLYCNNIDKIDVLKMDIEWMEFEVLSSRWDFEWRKIENLIIEIHLLDEKMELEWNQIFLKLKDVFWRVKIIDSCYRKEIFLVWAVK